MGVGDLGLSLDVFHRMTLGELQCRYMGYLRRVEREKDNLRHIMWSNLQPHSKRKIKPQAIMPLPMDKKPKGQWERVSIEDYKYLRDGKANHGS